MLIDFLRKQEEIYAQFRVLAKEAKERGIARDPNLEKRFGGFFVSLVHPPEVVRAIAEFSAGVASLVPAIRYGMDDVHTTLGSCGYGPGVHVDPRGNSRDASVMRAIADGVAIAIRRFTGECRVRYTGWLHTRAVVIARGVPNEGFLELARLIAEECVKNGAVVNLPWGAHITTNRFTGAAPPEQLADFFRFLEETPGAGESKAIGIAVGYSDWHGNGRGEPCGHFVPVSEFNI